MGILDKVKKVIDWKPPSSKQSGITDADTLYSDKTISYVEMYYNDNIRVVHGNKDGTFDQSIDYRHGRPTKDSIPLKTNIDNEYYLDGSESKTHYIMTKTLHYKFIVSEIVGLMVGMLNNKKHFHIY